MTDRSAKKSGPRGAQRPFQLSLAACLIAEAALGAAFAQDNPAPVALPKEIGPRLAKCWTPPRSQPPELIEVTVRLSFSRSGALIGVPRITYIRGPATLREAIGASALAAVKTCSP